MVIYLILWLKYDYFIQYLFQMMNKETERGRGREFQLTLMISSLVLISVAQQQTKKVNLQFKGNDDDEECLWD